MFLGFGVGSVSLLSASLSPVFQVTAGQSVSEPAEEFADWTSASDPPAEALCLQEPADGPV